MLLIIQQGGDFGKKRTVFSSSDSESESEKHSPLAPVKTLPVKKVGLNT